MKKFDLNAKEELLLETEYNPVYEQSKKARVDIYFILVMAVVGAFFLYVMKSIPAFLILAVLCGLVMVGCAIHYIYVIVTAKKNVEEEKYYITNVRVAITNKDGVIKKEIVAGKIKKVEVEKISGSKGTVFINKKEDTSRKAAVKKAKTRQTIYSADTVILRSINNSQEAAKIIENMIR